MRVAEASRRTVLFVATVFLISWGGILIVVGGLAGFNGTLGRDDPRFPLVYLAMLAGPVVSGLLFTTVSAGGQGFRALGTRLVRWRVAPRWYALALVTAPLTVVLVRSAVSADAAPVTVGAIAFGVLVGLGAGIFEELGWTGVATVELSRRFSMLRSGLILGVVWAAWHVLAMTWGIDNLAGPVPIPIFIAIDLLSALPAYRVLMVWLHARTQSLLLTMLMHASLTTSLLVLGPTASTGWELLAYDAGVAGVLWMLVWLFVRPGANPKASAVNRANIAATLNTRASRSALCR